jgi:hypothetical protein
MYQYFAFQGPPKYTQLGIFLNENIPFRTPIIFLVFANFESFDLELEDLT